MDPKEQIIKTVYEDLSSAACYSGIDAVLKEAKKYNKSITKKDVQNVLIEQKSYTLHKPRRIKYKRLKTIPIGFMTNMQADLADFQRISKYNDGFRYLLVTVDILSRQIFVTPVKSKSSPDMIIAFRNLFKKTPIIPQFLFTDKGMEFQAKELKEFYKKNYIIKQVAQSPDVKAAMAERAIRTIKTRLYKYFTHMETLRWVDIIDKIVLAINNNVNRTIKMRPNDVTFDNADVLWNRLYNQENNQATKNFKYKIGDNVRIGKAKKEFEKGYLPNYTDEVFTIDSVKTGQFPANYRLIDQKGEEILGKFYNEELSKVGHSVEKPTAYSIEKVLSTRMRKGKPEYLVQWKNLPLKKATWIRNSDIII